MDDALVAARRRGRVRGRGSLVLYMLIAAVLTFGQAIYSAQSVQQAADSIAREISRTPLPAVPDTLDPQGPNDPAFLNYVLYGNATSTVRHRGTEGVRQGYSTTESFARADSVDAGPVGAGT